ncbi:MAG TPA: class I SAM-dependent methyltransferase [Verrucomicrobiae bacterium]|jgi:SAM-dependent methyltransferase|nr:class I SAM-dependent methyltransferase [Verrucomicrobiae bacterium]
MALDFNSVKFLLWAKNLGVSFERTLTLGHQGFCCSPGQFKRAVKDFGMTATPDEIKRCFHHAPMTPLYADNFFRFLGATETASVDRSDFEDATLLHDLNERFPENVRGHFDLVVDGGTLEHIFNYPAALRNCLELLHVGGHFVTITPASGQMGHGFYQFSPELFFRVFRAENGFALRKIILFDCSKPESDFYEVNDPAATGQRTELILSKPLLMIVLAQKTAEVPVFAELPQQSDYAAGWASHEKSNAGDQARSHLGLFGRLRIKMNPYWPFWLRRYRDALVYRRHHGAPSLNNPRQFRRLKPREIYCERGSLHVQKS